MEAPERIYLRRIDEDDKYSYWWEGAECGGCRINPTDVEYVRRDVAVKLRAALDAVLTALDMAVKEPMPEIDNAWDKGDAAIDETAWLADSPQPPVSPDGESVKLWPWENSLGLDRAGIDGEQTPIWSLFSDLRISNCLARQGITKTGQARWLLETYGDDGLLWIRGLGTISLLRLKEALTLPDGESGEGSET